MKPSRPKRPANMPALREIAEHVQLELINFGYAATLSQIGLILALAEKKIQEDPANANEV